jgi:hypothetical protein
VAASFFSTGRHKCSQGRHDGARQTYGPIIVSTGCRVRESDRARDAGFFVMQKVGIPRGYGNWGSKLAGATDAG